MKAIRVLALALLLPLSAQALELPDLGESSRGAFSELQEAQMGREIMRQIRGDKDYLDDPEIVDYLNALGERLAAASSDPGRRFQFFAVRDASINAFALPGGFIGVHTGLLSAARNESELAGVLAHEISHVTQNHIARIIDVQSNTALVTLAAMAVAILAARSNSDVAQAAIVGSQAYAMQNQLDFTREHEREADRVGFQTLSTAGFAPEGMATFFQRLQEQGRLYDSSAPAYLRTHPLTYERIADMQNRLASSPYRQHRDAVEFALCRGKVMAEEGEAVEAVRRFQAATAARRDDPGLLYALSASALRAQNPGLAREALAELERLVDSPMVETLAARVDWDGGRREAALARLKAAVGRYGASKPLAYAYARTLLQAGRAAEALAFIQERRRLWPEDARLYALLAETDHALGRRSEGHLAQAEAYLLLDMPSAAMEQLQLAQKAGDGDYYTLSIVDARLRALREQEQREAERRARKSGG